MEGSIDLVRPPVMSNLRGSLFQKEVQVTSREDTWDLNIHRLKLLQNF